jgi:PAS domain S-box-containing protein
MSRFSPSQDRDHAAERIASPRLEHRHLEELLEQSPAIVGLMIGPEHRWIFVNKAFIQLSGRKRAADFIGKTVRESLPEVEGQGFLHLLDEVYSKGIPFIGSEMKISLGPSKAGKPKDAYFNFEYQPTRNNSGEVEGILIHAVDVTHQVLARKEVELSEQRLRLAQSAAEIGTWEWDPTHGTRQQSPELHRLLGIDPNDPEHTEKWMARVHPDDRERVKELLEESARTGSLDFEYRYHHPERGLRCFYCRGGRLGNESRMFGVVLDITDRKQSEEALRESEERFRAIVETTPECVKVVGPDGTLLHMNSAGLTMVGADGADMAIGKNVYDLIAPEDREKFREFNERICRGEKGSLEFDIVGLTGVRRHMETHAAPLKNTNGSVVQLAVTRDITPSTEAAEAQRRLAAIIESSEDAIASKDLNGTITSWNKSAERLFGYKAEEIVGQPVTTIIPPELHDDEPLILGKIRAGERIEHFRTVRLRKDGRRIDVSLTVSPVRDDKGKIVGAAKIVRDITRQNKLEEAARRLAAIVESSDDAIASKDMNGIITSWNRSAEKLFGYKAEEIIGKHVTTIIPPELHHDEYTILSKIRRGERIDHFETIRLRKDGERVEVSLTISPVKDENGNVVGAAKIIRNITENNKIERALQTTEKLAAAGRMAATVAHEINNPLEAVTNLVYLAKRDLANHDRVASYLEMASRELDRVAHITRQTLGFYRDTSSPVALKVTETLDDLLLLYEGRFQSRNIKVTRQYRSGMEITALAGEVRQAFSNLITNAIDAMPGGGKLVLRVSQSHEWKRFRVPGVRITILDTGSGIEPRHRKNMFQPFFTTKADVGTGLGLWITKSIVEKHGGTIRVRSRTGSDMHGTAFSLFLPTNYAGSPDPSSEANRPSSVPSTEKAIQ